MSRVPRIGFIGTGLMGAPMAANLIAAGFSMTVWNRTPARMAPVVEAGAVGAATPADVAAGADVVVTMLASGPVVTEVVFERGVAAAMQPGATLIDMSSIPPRTAKEHYAGLLTADVGHLDAPVSGGTRGAADGSLAIMVGGDRVVFGRCSPVLAALGTATYVGPAGSGQLAKLANQVVVAITIGAVAEGLLLASAAGADARAVRSAMTGGFADSRILREHGLRMLDRDFAAGGPVRLQLKDLVTAIEAAGEVDLELPVTGLVASLFQRLADDGDDDLDHSALMLVVERMNSPEGGDVAQPPATHPSTEV